MDEIKDISVKDEELQNNKIIKLDEEKFETEQERTIKNNDTLSTVETTEVDTLKNSKSVVSSDSSLRKAETSTENVGENKTDCQVIPNESVENQGEKLIQCDQVSTCESQDKKMAEERSSDQNKTKRDEERRNAEERKMLHQNLLLELQKSLKPKTSGIVEDSQSNETEERKHVVKLQSLREKDNCEKNIAVDPASHIKMDEEGTKTFQVKSKTDQVQGEKLLVERPNESQGMLERVVDEKNTPSQSIIGEELEKKVNPKDDIVHEENTKENKLKKQKKEFLEKQLSSEVRDEMKDSKSEDKEKTKLNQISKDKKEKKSPKTKIPLKKKENEEPKRDSIDDSEIFTKSPVEPKVSLIKHPFERKESGSLRWCSVAREIIRRSLSDENDTGSPDRRSTSSSSSVDSAKLPRMSSKNSLLEDISQGNLDNWDPETCVALLRIPSATNYTGIRKLIQQASQVWLEDFLSLDGLGILFESLARQSRQRAVSISDVLLQLECVSCIKAVMNSEVGLGHITRDNSYTRKLADALGNNSMMVKQQVFELLSALCMYSESGHTLALDALNNYKVYHGLRYRFQLIIDEIKQAEVPEYQACLLAFVNCIVLGESQIAVRCSLRNEFLGLNLETLLTVLRHCDCDAVYVQVDVFDTNHVEDQEELLGGSEEHQITHNHFEVFGELFEKIRDTPQALQLLTILKCLRQLDATSVESDDVWHLLERICVRSTGDRVTSTWSNALIAAPPKPKVSVGTQTVATKLKRKELPGGKMDAGIQVSPTSLASDLSQSSIPPPPPPPPGSGPPSSPPPYPPPPPPPPPGLGPPPPPPPPPPPLGLGPPPPPPLPGSGPPPPPPPPGSGPPPPPPPPGMYAPPRTVGHALAAASIPTLTQVLSSHLPQPRSKMKRLNWAKVTSQGIQSDSVWKEIEKEIKDLMPSNLNYAEIEELFCQRVIKENIEESSANKDKKKKCAVVTLLDPKTSLNVNIFLRQYKCPPDVVVSYVKECDIVQLGGDRLRSLLKILPEDSELEVIKDYKGETTKLGDPEKFFYHLLKIPSFRSRIEGMILMSEFSSEVNAITPQLDKFVHCCESLLHNEGIKQFFAYILTLGNFLNMGSYAGNALGFKLGTISKLWETRANLAGVTLLHYMEEQSRLTQSKILDFVNDLGEELSGTERISIDGIKAEVQNLANEVKKLRLKTENSDKEFCNQFQSFIQECEKALKSLTAKLESVEEYRVKLACYFCEDESKFRSEECIAIFLTLCNKAKEAEKENLNRHEREEKKKRREEERKRVEKEREELKASGVTLRTKKGFLPPKENEGCVVDVLLLEIRKGNFKLRKSCPQRGL